MRLRAVSILLAVATLLSLGAPLGAPTLACAQGRPNRPFAARGFGGRGFGGYGRGAARFGRPGPYGGGFGGRGFGGQGLAGPRFGGMGGGYGRAPFARGGFARPGPFPAQSPPAAAPAYEPGPYAARPYPAYPRPAYAPPAYGPPAGFGGDWRAQQNEVREAVRDGRHVPLGRAIDAVRARTPGHELDADLAAGPDGRPVYRLRWAANNGRRMDYLVDAATGAIVGVEGGR